MVVVLASHKAPDESYRVLPRSFQLPYRYSIPMDALSRLLDYNPTPLSQSSDYFPYPTRPVSPATFYEKHIDSSLVLKYIKPVPGTPLSQRLARKVDDALNHNQGINFDHGLLPDSDLNIDVGCTQSVSDAVSVALARSSQRGFSDAVRKVTSTLFYPSAPDRHWSSILQSAGSESHKDWSSIAGSYSAQYSLRIPPTRHDEDSHLNNDAKHVLRVLQKKKPHPDSELQVAVWEFFAVTAEDLIRDMDLGAPRSFHWETCVDRGAASQVPSPLRNMQTPDAASEPFLVDRPSLVLRLKPLVKRGSGKGKGKSTSCVQEGEITKRSKGKGKVNNVQPPNRRRGPDSNHVLQHAWTRAIINDATFIIFNCGNLERIGIRHRATQTLYLSELIDVVGGRDPAYGKLQVGLYMAIVQDLDSRLSILDKADDKLKVDVGGLKEISAKAAGKKRALEECVPGASGPSNRSSKKRKLERLRRDSEDTNSIPISHFEPTSAQAEISSRNLAFMRLQYGVYHSSTPASFLRTGPELSPHILSRKFKAPRQKTSYKPHEYFTVVLGPQVQVMPYTVAHKATLELGAGLGNATNATMKTVRHNDVIVKLGFSREGKERLLYEYRVYERLAQRGVGHVPCVLGMFQGMDVGGGGVVPSVLVMTDDGEALSAREGKVRVSPTEKAAFLVSLSAIHSAGVLHGNIQPSNLRVTSTGEVRITGFGDAGLDVVEDDSSGYLTERRRLKGLLVTETEVEMETDAAAVRFHRARPLVREYSGGRYFELREQGELEGEGDSGWSPGSAASLVIHG